MEKKVRMANLPIISRTNCYLHPMLLQSPKQCLQVVNLFECFRISRVAVLNCGENDPLGRGSIDAIFDQQICHFVADLVHCALGQEATFDFLFLGTKTKEVVDVFLDFYFRSFFEPEKELINFAYKKSKLSKGLYNF